MSGSGWTTVRIRHPRDRAAVVRALFAVGAEGVQELDEELVTHLREARPDDVIAAIRDADGAATVELSPTPDVDWSAEWRSRIGAHQLGRVVITPPWLADRFREDERVVIDPGMAFGTGEHETTRGVARLMQDVVRRGDHVADLGAGSAVLSIAAARLGARPVVAIEVDPDAIGNAEDNVRRNGVEDAVAVIEGDAGVLLPLIAPVRLVLANIISSVLVSLLPAIAAALAPDGRAILGGILEEERGEMERLLRDAGWRIEASDREGIWWSVMVARA